MQAVFSISTEITIHIFAIIFKICLVGLTRNLTNGLHFNMFTFIHKNRENCLTLSQWIMDIWNRGNCFKYAIGKTAYKLDLLDGHYLLYTLYSHAGIALHVAGSVLSLSRAKERHLECRCPTSGSL